VRPLRFAPASGKRYCINSVCLKLDEKD